jgi:hypothetical protein
MDPLKVLVHFNEKQPTFGRFRIIPMCAVLCIQHFFPVLKVCLMLQVTAHFFNIHYLSPKKKKKCYK